MSRSGSNPWTTHRARHEAEGGVLNIYLDTNLWNELCDQAVDPAHLVSALRAKGSNLAIGPHSIFELAKTFAKAPARGKELFSYISRVLAEKILYTKEITGILESEMTSLRDGTEVEPFASVDNYSQFRRDVEAFARGNFTEQAQAFVSQRMSLGVQSRRDAQIHFDNRPDVKARLKAINPEDLPRWLASETRSPQGMELLVGQIMRQFTDAPMHEVMSWAKPLIDSAACRLASGLVRADLYHSWRACNRGSLPKDLYHDMYHVLQAIHCDVYATKEGGQQDYTGLLLTRNTHVAIYDKLTPVDEWLKAEA